MIRLHFDAGHGGNDPGACANNMIEKNITLAVCLKIEEKLREYKDVEVFQTRTTDITQSLSEKSSIVNSKSNLDFCLSVHVNAAGGTGGEVWIQQATGKSYEYAKTIIGNHSFIGCNTNLVSPVKVEDNTYIAAGSTVTSAVKEGELAVARAKQRNIPGWVDKKGLNK